MPFYYIAYYANKGFKPGLVASGDVHHVSLLCALSTLHTYISILDSHLL